MIFAQIFYVFNGVLKIWFMKCREEGSCGWGLYAVHHKQNVPAVTWIWLHSSWNFHHQKNINVFIFLHFTVPDCSKWRKLCGLALVSKYNWLVTVWITNRPLCQFYNLNSLLKNIFSNPKFNLKKEHLKSVTSFCLFQCVFFLSVLCALSVDGDTILSNPGQKVVLPCGQNNFKRYLKWSHQNTMVFRFDEERGLDEKGLDISVARFYRFQSCAVADPANVLHQAQGRFLRDPQWSEWL